ncbi:MAG: hypothetical protein V8Q40_13035 [Anaerosacchariphilus sp.]
MLSDEIHGDIVYDGRKHIPLASLSKEFCGRTITCTSPSKTQRGRHGSFCDLHRK